MNNTTLKNVSELFLTSSMKISTEKKRNHMLKQLKMKVKLTKKQVLKLGISMFIETNQLFWIYSMDNSSLKPVVTNVTKFQLFLIHF
jgi:hypothetical protein